MIIYIKSYIQIIYINRRLSILFFDRNSFFYYKSASEWNPRYTNKIKCLRSLISS